MFTNLIRYNLASRRGPAVSELISVIFWIVFRCGAMAERSRLEKADILPQQRYHLSVRFKTTAGGHPSLSCAAVIALSSTHYHPDAISMLRRPCFAVLVVMIITAYIWPEARYEYFTGYTRWMRLLSLSFNYLFGSRKWCKKTVKMFNSCFIKCPQLNFQS